MQGVLTSIDTNRVDNGDVSLAGHGDALLVLFKSPNQLCGPLGAGARPVHSIRDISLRCNDLSAFGAKRVVAPGSWRRCN
jgi:hypothetical protein